MSTTTRQTNNTGRWKQRIVAQSKGSGTNSSPSRIDPGHDTCLTCRIIWSNPTERRSFGEASLQSNAQPHQTTWLTVPNHCPASHPLPCDQPVFELPVIRPSTVFHHLRRLSRGTIVVQCGDKITTNRVLRQCASSITESIRHNTTELINEPANFSHCLEKRCRHTHLQDTWLWEANISFLHLVTNVISLDFVLPQRSTVTQLVRFGHLTQGPGQK